MNGSGGENNFERMFAERERSAEQDVEQNAPTDSALDATHVATEPTAGRQEFDVVIASLLLEEELVHERQLSAALENWTIHGTESLIDHLVQAEVISESDGARLRQRATARLERLSTDVDATVIGSPDGDTTLTLQKLDSSGRAASLLGMNSQAAPQKDQQSRRFTERYTLLRKLGQGGLGTVWLARDDSLRRYVALKEVNDSVKHDIATISRFRNEAVITGRLEHPSIVPVHQLAQDNETGQTFYTMRFLGKQTMQGAIAEYHERREAGDHDPMLLHHLLSAFVSVCQAIGYAHSKGVVHRDLKPENVALDGYGQVIVLDWGLAKMIGEASLRDELTATSVDQDHSHRTVAGQVMGTPMYMAPEQAAGRIDEIDERTDVYGLGAILFAILTGDAPHAESHRSLNTNSRMAELLTAIMNNPTPAARSLNGDVPPELNAVCAKALARKRYARYASASALAEDVQRWMVGESVSAYSEPFSRRVQRWISTHRRMAQAAAAVTCVLLVASITLGIVIRQSQLAEQDTRFDAVKAEGRELEVRLKSRSAALGKNVRFMSNLPPIQGIIDARTTTQETDEEDVWRERLATIFRGLLIANPDYLAISFAAVAEDAQELVRVERHRADGSFVRVVPETRLGEFERRHNLSAVLSMKPGDVFMIDGASVEQEGVVSRAGDFTLLAATPIYDENSGDVFGVVLIESNMEQIVKELLDSTANTAARVYVTNGSGSIIMHHSRERGHQTSLHDRPIESLIPDLKGFFGQNEESDTLTEELQFHAVRVPLQSRRDSTAIGLVLTFED